MFANSVGSDTKNNVDMIKQTRQALDNLNKEYFNGTKVVYMYGFPFLFNEQYVHSTHDLFMVVGFALGMSRRIHLYIIFDFLLLKTVKWNKPLKYQRIQRSL